MPRDPRTRRLTRPATGGVRSERPGDAGVVAAPLVTLLARTSRLIDLLPQLHQHALDATGGDCSLLFEFNPGSGVMQATSGFGLDELRTEPWVPVDEEGRAGRRRVRPAGADARPRRPAADAGSHRAGWRRGRVLLLPLAREKQRLGLFVIGFQAPPSAAAMSVDTSEIADALLTALELFRLRQKDDLQSDLREVLDEFSSSLATTLNLGGRPGRFLPRRQPAVWRRPHVGLDSRPAARAISCSAPRRIPSTWSRGVRVSGDDSLAPAAAAMRRRARGDSRRAGRRADADRHGSAARLPARPRDDRLRRRPARRPAASSICWRGPTSSDASSPAPSKRCSFSTM